MGEHGGQVPAVADLALLEAVLLLITWALVGDLLGLQNGLVGLGVGGLGVASEDVRHPRAVRLDVPADGLHVLPAVVALATLVDDDVHTMSTAEEVDGFLESVHRLSAVGGPQDEVRVAVAFFDFTDLEPLVAVELNDGELVTRFVDVVRGGRDVAVAVAVELFLGEDGLQQLAEVLCKVAAVALFAQVVLALGGVGAHGSGLSLVHLAECQ